MNLKLGYEFFLYNINNKKVEYNAKDVFEVIDIEKQKITEITQIILKK